MQNRIYASPYILIFILFGLFYQFPTLGHAENVAMTSDADRFLRLMLGAEQRGMGGSFVASIAGSDAIGTNPAGIGINDDSRFGVHIARFPRTVATVAKPNISNEYEDYSQYDHHASGIETLNWVFPFGKFGTLGVAVSTGHEGSFRRVSHEGRALNNFPENNLATGVGYGLEFIEGTLIGIDAKWIRSKITDASGIEHFGRGYSYNVGLIQKIGQTLQVGVVLRNLSNGLSFADSTVPDKINRDVIFGVAYKHEIRDFSLRIGLDFHPPFADGIRTNVGSEIWFRDRVVGRIGYLRDTDQRYLPVMPVTTIADSSVEMEDRVWLAEGLSLGLGLRVGNFLINASHTPQFKPTVSDKERLHIVQGTSVYTFSIGQKF